jgi:N-formylglutamate amidohydrolase
MNCQQQQKDICLATVKMPAGKEGEMATWSIETNTNTTYSDHLTCSACLEVLYKNPFNGVSNEHYFCKKYINKHLTRSQTCPHVCQDELTPETLRQSYIENCGESTRAVSISEMQVCQS